MSTRQPLCWRCLEPPPQRTTHEISAVLSAGDGGGGAWGRVSLAQSDNSAVPPATRDAQAKVVKNGSPATPQASAGRPDVQTAGADPIAALENLGAVIKRDDPQIISGAGGDDGRLAGVVFSRQGEVIKVDVGRQPKLPTRARCTSRDWPACLVAISAAPGTPMHASTNARRGCRTARSRSNVPAAQPGCRSG